jgi:hypothetical protein
MRLFVAKLFLEVHVYACISKPYSAEPIRPLLQPVSACAVVASWRAVPHDKSTLTSHYLIHAPGRKKNNTKLVACAKSRFNDILSFPIASAPYRTVSLRSLPLQIYMDYLILRLSLESFLWRLFLFFKRNGFLQ